MSNQENSLELAPVLEAMLLAYGDPLAAKSIEDITGYNQDEIVQAVESLQQKYADSQSGIELLQINETFQLRTKAEYASFIQLLKSEKPRKLSPAALETLSIIAYRQPVVKSEIEKIRGVDVTPTLKTLLDRGLIKIVGQQASVGQPSLYGTTGEFLKVFGLSSLKELPNLRELADSEAESGEVSE